MAGRGSNPGEKSDELLVLLIVVVLDELKTEDS
jgi:hypothetical protein